MTNRLSDATQRHRLPPADLARIACACSSSAQHTAAITPKRATLSGSLNEFTPASRAMRAFSRPPDAAVAPTVRAHYP